MSFHRGFVSAIGMTRFPFLCALPGKIGKNNRIGDMRILFFQPEQGLADIDIKTTVIAHIEVIHILMNDQVTHCFI